MTIINCHTHVFNNDYVPANFARAFTNRTIANLLGPLLFNPKAEKRIARLLSFFGAKRLAAMIETGSQRSQIDVFDILKNKYPGGTKFVFLPMNMDYSGLGDPKLHVKAQLDFLVDNFNSDLQKEIFIFIPVDPRADTPDAVLQFVKDYMVRKCGGIKIYPPLGFYPNDTRLRPVYQYAQDNNIPITTHANKQGGFFYGPDKPDMCVLIPPVDVQDQFNPNEPNSPTKRFQRGINTSKFNAEVFRDNFMHPVNYYDVLTEFPGLKINFAHFGGADEILALSGIAMPNINGPVAGVADKNSAGDFSRWINYLLENFDNTYTDISYTLSDKKAITIIKGMMQNSLKLKAKVLYGTDFYVVEKEGIGEDNQLLTQAEDVFGDVFNTIALVNPINFLKVPCPLPNP